LQAGGANGSIKFRSGGAGEESANAGVWGGVLSAADINMYGKDMVAAVSQIDGTINNYGSAAHVFVNSGSLNVGNQVLSGDPNYYNNGGNVNLTSSSYTDAGSIAVVASGSITTASAVSIDPSASGSSVSLIAGYNFNVASPNNSAVNGLPVVVQHPYFYRDVEFRAIYQQCW